MAPSRDQVLQALERVIDPELQRPVTDLDMVRDVRIEGDAAAQRAVRFAVYHLVSAANPEDDGVSIPARALTGEGYRGHVFWETEVYGLPFYLYTDPDSARALLGYRWRTLPAARRRARELGWSGALFAWESADSGEDVTPRAVFRVETGRVEPIETWRRAHHIVADVAFAAARYDEATGDEAFFLERGAELLLSCAQFWASRAERAAEGSHIRDVVGPDEYHPGVDDDAYTNALAARALEQGAAALARLEARAPARAAALRAALGVRPEDADRWQAIARGLVLRCDPARGIYEQFDGYFRLEDIELSGVPRGPGRPVDAWLGPARVAASQVHKQPDVLLFLWLLRERYGVETLRANYRYYEPRCAHASSLSLPVHAAVAAAAGELEDALRYLAWSAAVDLDPELGLGDVGVHAGTLGGIWQAVVLGFGGVRPRADGFALDPRIPPGWRALRFRLRWRGRTVAFALGPRRAAARVAPDAAGPVVVEVRGSARRLAPGCAGRWRW